MSIQLSLALIAFAIILVIFISVLLVRAKLPIKYSLLWYAFAILILLAGLIPGVLIQVASALGFATLVNFIVACILAVLILLNVALTVMIASQRHRINLVSQELALLKKSVSDTENSQESKSPTKHEK